MDSEIKNENEIGFVTDAKILSGDRKARIGAGLYITFEISGNISKGQYVNLIHEGKGHSFEVTDIVISGENLSVDAKEIGYWASKLDRQKDLDLRSLLKLPLTLITDDKRIKDIYTQSCWC